MQRISIKQFRRFLNRLFHFDGSVHSLTDHRIKFIIPLSQIFKALFYTTILSINTFLSKDKFLRNDFIRKFIGSKRYMVASDSTLERALSGNIDIDELKNINSNFFKRLPRSHFVDKNLNRVCGIMDGTVTGKFMKEFMLIPGESNFILNFNTIPKRGKELPSAEKLIIDSLKIVKKGFFNLILNDGLYYSQNFFKVCLEQFGSHAFVKTQERLNIVKEADEIINGYPERIKKITGFDIVRQAKYTTYLIKDIQTDTIPYPVQISVVEEEYIKRKGKNKYEKFYCITTDLSLTEDQMRYCGHLRWKIENNGFKEMNKLFFSKHGYSKNETCFTNLLWIITMAYNLLYCYFSKIDLTRYGLKGKRVIFDWIIKLRTSLMYYYRFRLIDSS